MDLGVSRESARGAEVEWVAAESKSPRPFPYLDYDSWEPKPLPGAAKMRGRALSRSVARSILSRQF